MDWLRIVFYIFVFIALFIYVKVSQIRINGRSMIKLKYRILLALFFPLLFVLFLLIGSIIVGIALTVLFILGIWILLSRLGYKRRK